MKFTVNRTELLAAAQNAERIAPRVSTIEILQCAYLQAEQDTLTVASGNLEIALEQQLPASRMRAALSSRLRFFPECCACWTASA